jgi:hypothetical protein
MMAVVPDSNQPLVRGIKFLDEFGKEVGHIGPVGENYMEPIRLRPEERILGIYASYTTET